MNKQDLWRRNEISDQDNLERFCSDETQRWKDGRFAEDVECLPHSNDIAHDISAFVALLKTSAQGQ